jgi:hypothetical protein
MPGAFPEVQFGPDAFGGTGGDTLSTYSANYAAISGETECIIDATGAAKSSSGVSVQANRVAGFAAADHLDITFFLGADISSNDRYCGVAFKLSDATAANPNGYYLHVYRVAGGDTRGRLSLFASGLPSTTLAETTGIDILGGDGLGVRFFANGDYQLYTNNNGASWATNGSSGNDTTHTNNSQCWVQTESSVTLLTDLTLGTWADGTRPLFRPA